MPKNFSRYELRRSKTKRICQDCSVIIRKKQSYYRGVERENGVFTVTVLCCRCGALRERSKEENENKHEYRIFREGR